MPEIQSLIEMLQSENANKRYDACEQMRVSPTLTPEALEALQLVTKDANPDVADAAQRALTLHTPQLTPEIVNETGQEQNNIAKNTDKYWPLTGLLAGLLPVFVIANGFEINTYDAFGIGAPGFLLALVGAYISKRSIGIALIGAVVGSILWLFFLLVTCSICQ